MAEYSIWNDMNESFMRILNFPNLDQSSQLEVNQSQQQPAPMEATSGYSPTPFQFNAASPIRQPSPIRFNPIPYPIAMRPPWPIPVFGAASNQLRFLQQVPGINHMACMGFKAAAFSEPLCAWSGKVPSKKLHNDFAYSRKVFCGGVPWDVTDAALANAFSKIGPCRVESPKEDVQNSNAHTPGAIRTRRYVYVIFEKPESVVSLLQYCERRSGDDDGWRFHLVARDIRNLWTNEKVQIIPFHVSESSFTFHRTSPPQKTVFVGALHGLITAAMLAEIMEDLFKGVHSVSINMDKYKYPIGSGKVIFTNYESYHKALSVKFVEIKTPKFNKKIQIDPYLHEVNSSKYCNYSCSNCKKAPGLYFCGEATCCRFFCSGCWQTQHELDVMKSHKPLVRIVKHG